jgi:DNA-binding MarR family transcriptional regulator
MASGRDAALGFLQLLWEVDHELQILSKRMEVRLGLTGPQRLALIVIARHPELSAGELAARLKLDPSTVTGLLRRLEASGLIRREWDRLDGRRMRLTLTARGQRANRRRVGTVEGAVREVLGRTTAADRAATARVMQHTAAALRRAAARHGGA